MARVTPVGQDPFANGCQVGTLRQVSTPTAVPGTRGGPLDHVNMVDVARRAGVSTATVSRALRDVAGVSETTRQRVRRVAEELAYVVSPEASRLATQRTRRVALVVPRIDIWFYAAMVAGVERELRRADLDVLVYQVDGVEERRRFFRDLPARRKVDAVVLVALPVLAEEEGRLDLLGVEVVVAGGRLGRHAHARVDDLRVAGLATGHLLALGHREVVMVRTDDTDGTRWSSDVERTRGFADTLRAAGLPTPEDGVVTVGYGSDAGVRGAEVLLARPHLPTAVFAYSDEIALGVVARLRGGGVRVPEDVSVVGVDDHPMAAVLGLTTVDQRVEDQARAAGRSVVALLGGEPGRDVVASPRLVVRTTTAPPA